MLINEEVETARVDHWLEANWRGRFEGRAGWVVLFVGLERET